MAQLRGATYTFTLPRTGVRVNLPAERLFHVDGTPREAFEPSVRVAETGAEPLSEGDLALRAGLSLVASPGEGSAPHGP
jgi:carboxyl-terminal processing protease